MIKNLLLFIFIFFTTLAYSQYEAHNYLVELSNDSKAIENDTWSYMKAAAHGKSARKVDKRRKELLETLKGAIYKTKKVKSLNNDPSLKHALVEYYTLTYDVLNQDYAKILDMEAIAEESYDAMEAYIMAQQLAGDKLEHAGDKLDSMFTTFAKVHNIKILDEEGKKAKKLRLASEATKYYNTLYLIFFKSYKQEMYVFDAIQRNDLSGIEQNKNTLLTFSREGLDAVNSNGSFKGDPILKIAGLEMLKFYKYEAETGFNDISEFLLAKDKMEKIASALEAKKQSQRTKEDIDAYNAAIIEYNAVLEKYNKTNSSLNKKRADLLKNWNNKVEVFMSKHVPK